jgi:hypothetical protein
MREMILTEEASETQEKERVRHADADLHEDVVAAGYEGPQFEMLRDELWAYAVRTLKKWLRKGTIGKHCKRYNFVVAPTESELELWRRSEEPRHELAIEMVAAAMPLLVEKTLPSWDPYGGAGLRTYFIVACLYHFPNILRNWRSRFQRQVDAAADSLDELLHQPADGLSVEEWAATRDRIRRALGDASPEVRAICSVLYEEDLTYKEIGAKLGGMTSRAVEGHLRRFREKPDPSPPKGRQRGPGGGNAGRRTEEPLLFGGEAR